MMVSFRCSQILCIVHSSLLFVFGLVLIGFGSYLSVQIFTHYKFIPGSYVGPFLCLIMLGIVHLPVTWLGVKGPEKQHNMFIIMFIIFSAVLLLSEFTVGVWSMVYWGETKNVTIIRLTDYFRNTILLNKATDKTWIKFQRQMNCCGLNGVHDKEYRNSCEIQFGVEIEGCERPYYKFIKHTLLEGAIMAFLFAVFQAIGIFLFYILYRALQEKRNERRQQMQREVSGEQLPPPTTLQRQASAPVPTSQ